MRAFILIALLITGCVFINAPGDNNDVSIRREAGGNSIDLLP